MKKLLLIIAGLLILATPVFFLYVLNNGNPIMNKWITHEVKKHLDGTDYDESDFFKSTAITYLRWTSIMIFTIPIIMSFSKMNRT